MKLHKFILVLNLVVGAYSITNDDANAQQEFKRICLSDEHMQASCNCVCQQLAQVYSPQIVQRLNTPVCKVLISHRTLPLTCLAAFNAVTKLKWAKFA